MTSQYSDSTLYINLAAVRDNYLLLKSKAKGAETAAVVKANGYGLGVKEIAGTLKKAGCKKFFVATLDEALELKDSCFRRNDGVEILAFNGIRKGQEKIFCENKIIPVLNTLEEAKLWGKNGNNLPACLHVDTGMNRLGLGLKEAENFESKINIKYLMSHLACADQPDHPKNAEQLKAFRNIEKFFPNAKKSLANSAGIVLGKGYHFDLVRPGIALYAGANTVVTLKAKIIQIRKIDRPTTVGYGATANVAKGTIIATLPVGYADGYLRVLGNTGHCFIGGVKVPVIGRVSMDLLTLDVTKVKNPHVGMEVELIGKHLSVDEIAGQAETISYEILTRLGSRFDRIYLEK